MFLSPFYLLVFLRGWLAGKCTKVLCLVPANACIYFSFFISSLLPSKIVSMTTDPSFLRRRPLRRFLRHWLERHQHPFNFAIHLIGIPLAFAGVAMFFTIPWPGALAAFVSGYALQWIGHCVEGNDMGEWAGIKRLLGWPYIAIAPRRTQRDDNPV